MQDTSQNRHDSGNFEDYANRDGYDQILKGVINSNEGEGHLTGTQKRLRSAFQKYVSKEVKKEVGDDAQVLKIMRREHRDSDNSDFRRFSVISQPII